jgi:hypothetical protein
VIIKSGTHMFHRMRWISQWGHGGRGRRKVTFIVISMPSILVGM